MIHMDALEFLNMFAWMQAEKGGAGHQITPQEIVQHERIPRSTVYHHLNTLMKRGYITRERRGRYCLRFSPMNVGVGMCVITYWDVMEYAKYPSDYLRQFEGWSA